MNDAERTVKLRKARDEIITCACELVDARTDAVLIVRYNRLVEVIRVMRTVLNAK